jgi:two-component system, NarL family, response regulator DevR
MEAATRTHVYIVEDSPAIRANLREMLERTRQVDVVGEADNPKSAIAGILASRPQIVILDIHLIGGTGVEVLRSVHPQAPEIVFIVLTNYPNDQYHRVCMELGASHFLDKNNEFMKIKELVSGGSQQIDNRIA